MKKLLAFTFILSFFNFAVSAGNLSDNLDKNNTPAQQEERENEIINSSDAVDINDTPQSMEEREKEEQVESDFSQTDDPEVLYDADDQEVDE